MPNCPTVEFWGYVPAKVISSWLAGAKNRDLAKISSSDDTFITFHWLEACHIGSNTLQITWLTIPELLEGTAMAVLVRN